MQRILHDINYNLLSKMEALESGCESDSVLADVDISIETNIGAQYSRTELGVLGCPVTTLAKENREPQQTESGVSLEKPFFDCLKPKHARWFYKDDDMWLPFCGFDSLRLEQEFRQGADRAEGNLVCVRGQLYEADIVVGVCKPIYWAEEPIAILRGIWFWSKNWQPLAENVEGLEAEHLVFLTKKNARSLLPPKKSIIHKKTFVKWHVEWTCSEVRAQTIDKSSKFSWALGAKTAMQLERGFVEDARMEDRLPNISHLVFVAHGARHRDRNTIVRSCNKFQATCEDVISSSFPEVGLSGERVQLIPLQWRRNANVDTDLLDAVTLDNAKGFRNMFNKIALDMMFYLNPDYKDKIAQAIRALLHETYEEFCKRNPYFKENQCKVSFIGHSLGAVILFDIMTGWASSPPESDAATVPQQEHISDRSPQVEEDIHRPVALTFAVENFFCIGSILPAFLTLRTNPADITHKFEEVLKHPHWSRLFNVYQPLDPVAYRLEPLLNREYAAVPPVQVRQFQKPKKLSGGKGITEGGTTRAIEGLKHRLDYQLTHSKLESALYLALLTSHVSYWSSPDFAAFFLEKTFPRFKFN